MEFSYPMDGVPLQRGKAVLFFALLTCLTINKSNLAIAAPIPVGTSIPTVRVLVTREPSKILIQGFDLEFSNPISAKAIQHFKDQAAVEVKCKLGGKIVVQNQKEAVSSPLLVKSRGGFIRLADRQYRDELYVYSINGDCALVNHVDLEKYVAGVLDSEMNASWSLQALKAQAIAARTYALYQMKESLESGYASGANYISSRLNLKSGLPYDVDSSVKDQVYEGAHREKQKTIQAVHETKGVVLTSQGDLIKSFYHSTCGGRTETPDRVWGVKLPYFKSVDCPYCYVSPRFNWRYEVQASVLESALLRAGFLQGRLLGMRVVKRNILGRAKEVEIIGSLGNKVVEGTKLREVLGTTNIKSTAFRVTSEYVDVWGSSPMKLIFQGHGSGHGVGMCQYGAKNMADLGKSYLTILKQYYPKAQVTKLY